MTEKKVEIGFAAPGWRTDLDRFMAENAAGMNGYMLTRRRLACVIRLHGLSDAALAGMGLSRADIPAFVFEDVLPGRRRGGGGCGPRA